MPRMRNFFAPQATAQIYETGFKVYLKAREDGRTHLADKSVEVLNDICARGGITVDEMLMIEERVRRQATSSKGSGGA